MPSITVAVGSAVGLHARPATIIAEAVAAAEGPVTLATEGGEPVDAGSALMIMTLGAEKGTPIVVTADDQSLLDTVADLVARDLDAE